MAKNEDVTISFQVPPKTAKRMEALRKWIDQGEGTIWDINHYAKRKFLDGFNADDAAKKEFDEEAKAAREAEKRRREAEKERLQMEAEKREKEASANKAK